MVGRPATDPCFQLLSTPKSEQTRTYDHRHWKIRDPVRSPTDKPATARLVVGWVTTSESPVFKTPSFFAAVRHQPLCDQLDIATRPGQHLPERTLHRAIVRFLNMCMTTASVNLRVPDTTERAHDHSRVISAFRLSMSIHCAASRLPRHRQRTTARPTEADTPLDLGKQ